MGLTVSIELLSGSYEASEVDDRERAEWPPHPARVFCALVAAARDEQDLAALRWLESCPPPLIAAASQPTETRRAGYVVVNSLSASGGSQFHPGRTNGLRVRTRAVPSSPLVVMTWPGDAAAATVAALDEMARRIPYLGRSSGVALVGASASIDSEPAPGLVVYEPCDLLDRESSVRIPYPGFLAELDSQFAADRPAWEVCRYQGYRRRPVEEEACADDDQVVPSVYTDLVGLRFAGLRPHAELTTRFTTALRSAVLAVAGDDAPAVLHGHGAAGRPHVAFLALPDVGGPHSDGHLLGLAVAIPDLPDADRRAVLAAVGGLRRGDVDGSAMLSVPGIGTVELSRQPGHVRPWGATPRRWRQGSRHWVSATPVILDRYPKRPERIEPEIRASLRMLGLPDPVDLRISVSPLTTGAARLRPSDLPPRVRGRVYRHIAVSFDRRVSGPVLVGAGRYLGIGLLAPVRGNDD